MISSNLIADLHPNNPKQGEKAIIQKLIKLFTLEEFKSFNPKKKTKVFWKNLKNRKGKASFSSLVE